MRKTSRIILLTGYTLSFSILFSGNIVRAEDLSATSPELVCESVSEETLEGQGTVSVGTNVTAEVDVESGTVVFHSNEGTLSKDWLDQTGLNESDVKTVRVGSGTVYMPEDSSCLFQSFNNMTSLDLSGFNTSHVKDMHEMFEGCGNLTSLDVSGFDTSQVEDMSSLFSACSGLTSLDLSSFDTSNVTDMSEMFFYCLGLESLDLSSFDTSNVNSMEYMFSACDHLTSLNVDGFDTSSVTDMGYMFSDCYNLTELDVNGFDTSNVTKMNYMFAECNELRKLDLSSFDTGKVTDMQFMFIDCWCIPELDLKGFDTSNVTNMYAVFAKCVSLTELDLSGFNTSNVTDMSCLFDGSYRLQHIDLSGFDTSKVKDMKNMFNECWQLTELDLSSFDLSNVTSGECFLMGCEGLETLRTPVNNSCSIELPALMYDEYENTYIELPQNKDSLTLKKSKRTDIGKASVSGLSLSYGFSGRDYTPSVTVKVGGKVLRKEIDYTVQYLDNRNPGTATVKIIGTGDYIGTRIKTFEIVKCASSIESGKTYLLIPKNNSETAVCAFAGKMVNNTKVHLTGQSGSEAMKFRAVRNSDGTWKFINAKSELALAVQQNSKEPGKGLVLYEQTTRKAQNWKLVKKYDNSYALINAVTGYSVAVSDTSAGKGSTLSMAETAGSGLQRFYLAEADPVNNSYSGIHTVRACKNRQYALNINSSSVKSGANVNLYTCRNTDAQKFRFYYSGGGYYRLINVNSGLAVTAKPNGDSDSTNVIQIKWTAQDGQRWKISKASNGTVILKNAAGTVLHLKANAIKNGNNVMAKTSASTTAQRWYLE